MSLERFELNVVLLSGTALGGFSRKVEPNYCHPRSIEVSGIGRGTTVEHLRLLFENQRRSGGGEIDEVEYDDEETTAIITFTDAHGQYMLI